MPFEPIETRFWKRVNKTDNCWEWIGKVDALGYGTIFGDGKANKAHRYSFELHNKREINRGMNILHSCDNRRCVNPSHLREGTQKENIQDRVERNRTVAPKGESNGLSKLTADNVISIRQEALTNTYSEIAKKYNTTKTNICSIVKRYTWKHI